MQRTLPSLLSQSILSFVIWVFSNVLIFGFHPVDYKKQIIKLSKEQRIAAHPAGDKCCGPCLKYRL